jgi:hypothetical protein
LYQNLLEPLCRPYLPAPAGVVEGTAPGGIGNRNVSPGPAENPYPDVFHPVILP